MINTSYIALFNKRSFGNPHVVFFIENIDKFNLEKIGPEIENHELFPEKCNVTLAKKISENLIKVKVWERGAGLQVIVKELLDADLLKGNTLTCTCETLKEQVERLQPKKPDDDDARVIRARPKAETKGGGAGQLTQTEIKFIDEMIKPME